MSDTDFNMTTKTTDEAENELSSGGGPGRNSKYEPVAQKYTEIDEDEAIVLRELSKNDVQNLRNLMYRRFGKEDVIVRSSKQGDDEFKAVVRDREDGEYLRNNDSDDIADTSKPESDPVSEDTDSGDDVEEDVEDVF